MKELLKNSKIDTDDLSKKTGLTQEDIMKHLHPEVIKRLEQGVENPMAPQQDYLKQKLVNMAKFVENFCVKPAQRDTEIAIAESVKQKNEEEKGGSDDESN